jgi:hypothetical protein
MSSCYWGCHGKEHVFEYLAGRTCISAQSAYRLIGFGYYDEALALSRNIAEIGNLVHLFFSDTSHIRLWLDLPPENRRKEYSPVMVRTKLQNAGVVVPVDRDLYAWLCEIGTHVTPQTLPQAHNQAKRPILGGVFQEDGGVTSLETLAWAVCTVAAPLAKLAQLEREFAERLFNESVELVELL